MERKKKKSKEMKRIKKTEKRKDYQKEKTFLYVIPFWKQKTSRLNSRKVRIFLRDFLFGFQDFLYYRYSKKIYFLISIG